MVHARKAISLGALSSSLVPLGGLLTAPLLARGLGADGRGELAAAIAPAILMLAVATMGLPEALTYHLARHPGLTNRLLAKSSLLILALGAACVGVVLSCVGFLSAGDPQLGRLILLGTLITVPALCVNVLRGASSGLQLYELGALDRLIGVALRVLALAGLYFSGHLTVVTAVVVSTGYPLVSGVVYVFMFRRRSQPPTNAGPPEGVPADEAPAPRFSDVASYGQRTWFGSVASMVAARADTAIMVPLSSAAALGVYSVATTVSDVPWVLLVGLQSTLFALNSRSMDARQLTRITRLTLLTALVGCMLYGASAPLWLGRLFGHEFDVAIVPVWILLSSAVVSVPGLTAAIGLSAWGRPGLRSLGLMITLVVNLGTFVLLVPRLGVYGACWAGVLGNLAMSVYMVEAASRVLGTPRRDFVIVGPSDARRLVGEIGRASRAVSSRLSRGRRLDDAATTGSGA